MTDTSFPIVLLGEALFDVFPDRDVIGGAPFNVARNLAAFGARPLMVTRVGTDARGDAVAGEYRRFGMDARGLQYDAARPTGTVTVHMDGTHHTFEIHADQAWDRLDAATVRPLLQAARPRIVYFGTLAQREAGSRAAIREALAATDAVPFLDLNLREGPDNRTLAAESLSLARLVKVNDDELMQLLTWFGTGAPPAWGSPAWRTGVERLMAHHGVRRLVITQGAAGWTCFDAQHDVLTGTSPRVTVRDTVGAGDAFASVLLLGELQGWPLETTLQRAADFAAQVCTVQGAVGDGTLHAEALRHWA